MSSPFLSPRYFFPLSTCLWGWTFQVCCHQAIHNSHSEAVPAPTSQRLPGPCVSPWAGHLTSHLQGGAVPPVLEHKCFATLPQRCYRHGGQQGYGKGATAPSPAPAQLASLGLPLHCLHMAPHTALCTALLTAPSIAPRMAPGIALCCLSLSLSVPYCVKAQQAGGFASTFLRQLSSSPAQLLPAVPSPHVRQTSLRSVIAKPLPNMDTSACSLFCPIMSPVEVVCDVMLSLEKGIQHLHSGAININLTCIFMGKICLLILRAMSQLFLPLLSQPHLRCIIRPKMEVLLFNKPSQSPDPPHSANPFPKHITLLTRAEAGSALWASM